jgi:hypothetical protein
MVFFFFNYHFRMPNADMIAQGLLEQGKQPQSPPQHQHGHRINSHAG